MSDPQDMAESLDDDLIGRGDAVFSDEVEIDYPPDRPAGLPFADSDVTDESFAARSLQEEPEVSPLDIDESDADDAATDDVSLDDLDPEQIAEPDPPDPDQ